MVSGLVTRAGLATTTCTRSTGMPHNGAVEQLYDEMTSRHHVRSPCIQLIKTAIIKACKLASVSEFQDTRIKFPLVFKKVRSPTRKLKTTFKASRPNLFM